MWGYLMCDSCERVVQPPKGSRHRLRRAALYVRVVAVVGPYPGTSYNQMPGQRVCFHTSCGVSLFTLCVKMSKKPPDIECYFVMSPVSKPDIFTKPTWVKQT